MTATARGYRPLGSTWALLATAVCISCAMLALAVSQRELRWQLYAMVGLIVATVALATDVKKLLISSFVVGLSINVHYYLTTPPPPMGQGNTSPTALSIPLVMIPVAALLLRHAYMALFRGIPFRWGWEITSPAALLIGTTALSALVSPVRFFGACTVFELLQYFLIFLTAVNVCRDERDARLVVKLLLVTLAFQCAICLLQTAMGVSFTMTGQILHTAGPSDHAAVRATGTVGTIPSGFATFVEPLILIALAIFRCTDSRKERFWNGLLFAVGVMAVALTLNRTSWVGLPIGVVCVEMLCRRQEGVPRVSAGAIVMLAVACLGGLILAWPWIAPRLLADHGDDLSVRLGLAKVAWNMIVANPVIGVGPGAYAYVISGYLPSGLDWVFAVHSEYLTVWAERGTVGLIAWLLWLRSGWREALACSRRSAESFATVGIGCTAGLVVLVWEFTWNSGEPFSTFGLLWLLFGLFVSTKEPGRAAGRKLLRADSRG